MRPELPYEGPEFLVRCLEESGVHVIAARGDLDLATSPAFAAQVERLCRGSRQTPVIVDLCEASFVDSNGLHTVLCAQRRIAEQGRAFALVAPTGGQVHRLLELTATEQLVRRCPDRTAAINTVQQSLPDSAQPASPVLSRFADGAVGST